MFSKKPTIWDILFKWCRQFYILYPQIGATVSHQFITKPDVLVNNLLFLHIREIMVIDDAYLDYILFRDKPGYTMTLNIGGIANLHVANADRRRMFGFDTGPGNIISNYMCKVLFGLEYDKDGAIAASGKVNDELMDYFMQHPFWDRPVPRSGWSQDYSEEYIKATIQKFSALPKEDCLLMQE